MISQKITSALIILASLLLVGYVFWASTISSLGYKLDSKERELSKLQQVFDELVVNLAASQSPDFLELKSRDLSLVEVDVVSRYIDTRAEILGRAGQ